VEVTIQWLPLLILFGKYLVHISAHITAVLTEVYYDVSLLPGGSRDGI